MNPACGNFEEKIKGGTDNIYLPYNVKDCTNQTIFPALCKYLTLVTLIYLFFGSILHLFTVLQHAVFF